MSNALFYSACRYAAAAAIVSATLVLPACHPDNSADSSISPNRISIYDPMRDAAPGDETSAVPSVSDISPDQVQGGGGANVLIPGNGTAATSLGALGGGRR